MSRLIFEKDSDQRYSSYINASFSPEQSADVIVDKSFLRDDFFLPSLGELEVVRHYTKLAKLDFSVDGNFYPLGSCTMKYNPKINEKIASSNKISDIHPYQKEEYVQAALEIIYELEQQLIEITGMNRFTFQASSGAQGEFTGIMMIHNYHKSKVGSGQPRTSKKTKVIVPDSSHGTNPATVSMCGYKTIVIESNKNGLIDLDKLAAAMDEETAGIMLTNPNTLGLFEEDILKICEIVHSKGGLVYYDGANFNALLGITKPALMGFDVIHLNLHKTFSTPHGCGGPGAGAVGVNEKLVDFLPRPLVDKKEDKFIFNKKNKNSIGRVRSFYGNFAVIVRAYVYLLRLGSNGVKRVAQNAVLNASYIKEMLKGKYKLASDKSCMHEAVFSCVNQKERGASAFDIAKKLIEFDIHPPTMYFPLTAKEALMVEPTECESKQTLDCFIAVMKQIDDAVTNDLQSVKAAPCNTPVRRPDEVRAARCPDLRYTYGK